jgi:hypothetical protein
MPSNASIVAALEQELAHCEQLPGDDPDRVTAIEEQLALFRAAVEADAVEAPVDDESEPVVVDDESGPRESLEAFVPEDTAAPSGRSQKN